MTKMMMTIAMDDDHRDKPDVDDDDDDEDSNKSDYSDDEDDEMRINFNLKNTKATLNI
jgi:hypothetical protein